MSSVSKASSGRYRKPESVPTPMEEAPRSFPRYSGESASPTRVKVVSERGRSSPSTSSSDPMSDSEKYAASPRHSCSSEGSLPALRDGRLISAGREISLNGTAASPVVSRASVLKLPSAACTSEASEKTCTSSSVNPSVEISR